MEGRGEYQDDTSPPIMIAEAEDGDDHHQEAGAAQDWQIIEDGLLSQCGSSPRSLSVKDLDSLERSTPEAGSEEDAELQPDLQEVSEGLPGGNAIPTSSHASPVIASDAEEPGQDLRPSRAQSLTNDESQALESSIDDVTPSEDGLEEAEGVEGDTPETCLSDHSSYADVSLADSQRPPFETVNQELVDSLSASGISEMIAAADAGSESELGSDPEVDTTIPDTGVFSIATGYPLETMLFRGHTPALGAEPFARPEFDPSRSASLSGSESLSSTAGESLPYLQPERQEASKWRDWLQSTGNTRAAKFLHHIWYQLQVVARRAGACIPFGLRKRVAHVLKCIDNHVSKGGRGSTYIAYGAAVVGFVLALRYYRECRRLRQMNLAQKDAFDMHVLKVLDLNEKLGRGMNIPITYNCGLKDLSFARRSYTHRPVGFPHSFLTVVP